MQQNLTPADWLTFPEQKLLSITAGGVFHDDLGLEAIRQRLAYYPHDVWLYVMATAWNRIGQDEHLMGRAGHAGDEIGSAVIGARLVRDVMRICFQQERRYAPYPKWLGTGFARLRAGPLLSPILQAALLAPSWQERGCTPRSGLRVHRSRPQCAWPDPAPAHRDRVLLRPSVPGDLGRRIR